MYACRRRTSSLSKAELKVELFLTMSSRACKVPTSAEATLNVSFFATLAWRWQNANYGSLGTSVGPYFKLKVEWMKDLASTSLNAKSSTLLHASAQLIFHYGSLLNPRLALTVMHGRFSYKPVHQEICRKNWDRTKPTLGQFIFAHLICHLEISWTLFSKPDSLILRVNSAPITKTYSKVVPRPFLIIETIHLAWYKGSKSCFPRVIP